MTQQPVPIVAFAPRRWAAMPGASQRALAQLAKGRSVFVLETPEPIEVGDREFWELSCDPSGLLVCRPRVAHLEDLPKPRTARMAQALLHWLDVDDFVAWVYSESSAACARALAPSLVIHDRSLEPAGGRRRAIRTIADAGASGTL
jgi:hypothetical protein